MFIVFPPRFTRQPLFEFQQELPMDHHVLMDVLQAIQELLK